MWIAQRYDGTNFYGSIDEVALYGSNTDSSGALSAGLIANHYAAATSGPVATPVDEVPPLRWTG
jgi:hypothetical protein